MNKSKSMLILLAIITISILTITTIQAQDPLTENNNPDITSFTYNPHLLPIMETVTAEITYSDLDSKDTHRITFDWGDGESISGTATTASHIYQEPGIYQISVTVDDNNGGIITMIHSSKIIVYDTMAGFTSGGGWIICPHDVTGEPSRGYFGFIAKYHGNTIKGNVVFHIKDGLRFKSTEIYWLIITGENRVIYGIGLLNDEIECLFTVKVKDGVPGEGFDIILVNPDTWEVIYDSYESTYATYYTVLPLEGGNIATHKSPKQIKEPGLSADKSQNSQTSPTNENSTPPQPGNNGKAHGKMKNTNNKSKHNP